MLFNTSQKILIKKETMPVEFREVYMLLCILLIQLVSAQHF
jgi:hypothetical protein